jgi:hypothetical protein
MYRIQLPDDGPKITPRKKKRRKNETLFNCLFLLSLLTFPFVYQAHKDSE